VGPTPRTCPFGDRPAARRGDRGSRRADRCGLPGAGGRGSPGGIRGIPAGGSTCGSARGPPRPRTAPRRRCDPDAFLRDAESRISEGHHARAVRLRFVGGVLDMARARPHPYESGLTTDGIARQVSAIPSLTHSPRSSTRWRTATSIPAPWRCPFPTGLGCDASNPMIPRSTTLTAHGRRARERLLWGLGALVAFIALAFAFVALDRSTVVDGPTGSSFATTATGTAALHDTLARVGREPVRLLEPLSPALLLGSRDLPRLRRRVRPVRRVRTPRPAGFRRERGLGPVRRPIRPRAILESFDVELQWSGTPVGAVGSTGRCPMPSPCTHPDSAHSILSTRVIRSRARPIVTSPSGSTGEPDRSSSWPTRPSVTTPRRPGGQRRLSRRSHRRACRLRRIPPRVLERLHRGLVAAAPGNWSGALVLGGIVLVLALVSYGRRFGPVEPENRQLVPDRSTYIDAVARSLRRTRGAIPVEPMRAAVLRRLRLARTPAAATSPRRRDASAFRPISQTHWRMEAPRTPR
jgi:hypothetical protein